MAMSMRSIVFIPLGRQNRQGLQHLRSIRRGYKSGPLVVYNDLVANGDGSLRNDPVQRQALVHLQKLYDDVVTFAPNAQEYIAKNKVIHDNEFEKLNNSSKNESNSNSITTSISSFMQSIFGSKSQASSQEKEKDGKQNGNGSSSAAAATSFKQPRGVYLHSGPGSGKTFLMDLYFQSLPPTVKARRLHFNEFMLEVHRTLHSLQKKGITGEKMMNQCVDALLDQAWMLCFDEFQVTDIADAMVMRRLFEMMFKKGLVMVATSNREPDELYKNGLKRELFIPCIEQIKVYCRTVQMQSAVDYRMLFMEQAAKSGKSDSNVYFVIGKDPKDPNSSSLKERARFARLWERLTNDDVVHNVSLSVQGGRKLKVPECARHSDVAKFTFDELCGQPLGAADYFALACSFHTVFLEDVPTLSLGSINPLRRFITLVDTLYDRRVVLVISAQAPIEGLLSLGEIKSEEDTKKYVVQEIDLLGSAENVPSQYNIDEIFAFNRTISRLREMGTPDYLEKVQSGTRATVSSPVRFLSSICQTSTQSLSEGEIRSLWDRYDLNNDDIIDTKELRNMIEEMTLFLKGHRHVPIEVEQLMLEALNKKKDGRITYDEFRDYFLTHGLTVRG